MDASLRAKIINTGKVTLTIGTIFTILALFGLLLGFESYFEEPDVDFIFFVRRDLGFFTGVILQFFLGLMTIFSGIGLKHCKEWGRKFIVVAISIVLCILFVFTIIWQINVLSRGELTFFKIIFSMMGIGVSLLIGIVLWRSMKFFMSEQISRNCD